MAGHGGGAWKVAYADFVTAMMAFFLVMWITAQGNSVKQSIAQYFRDPWKTSKKPTGDFSPGSPLLGTKKPNETPGPSPINSPRRGSASGIEKDGANVPGGKFGKFAARELDAKSQKNEKTKVTTRSPIYAVHDGDRRCVGTLVLFKEGTAEIDDVGKQRLGRFANEVRGKPYKIEIRGHASRNPSHDAWQISYARCRAAQKFLEDRGIESDRIRLSQGGPHEPYSIRVDPAKQAFNSRIEVYMLNEFAEDSMGTPEERASRFITP